MNIIETDPTKKMKANYNEVLQTKNRNKKLFTRIKSSLNFYR